MVQSPKVATYDLQPEMNAAGVAEDVAKTVATGTYEFVMCNFAPPDMVGHTGVLEKCSKGVEATDTAIGVILEACKAAGYALFITSDHGNAEVMLTEDGKPVTSHTTNNVPFIAFDPAGEVRVASPHPLHTLRRFELALSVSGSEASHAVPRECVWRERGDWTSTHLP